MMENNKHWNKLTSATLSLLQTTRTSDPMYGVRSYFSWLIVLFRKMVASLFMVWEENMALSLLFGFPYAQTTRKVDAWATTFHDSSQLLPTSVLNADHSRFTAISSNVSMQINHILIRTHYQSRVSLQYPSSPHCHNRIPSVSHHYIIVCVSGVHYPISNLVMRTWKSTLSSTLSALIDYPFL